MTLAYWQNPHLGHQPSNGRAAVDDHAVVVRREHLRRGRLVYPRIVTATATAVSTTAPGRCVQSR